MSAMSPQGKTTNALLIEATYEVGQLYHNLYMCDAYFEKSQNQLTAWLVILTQVRKFLIKNEKVKFALRESMFYSCSIQTVVHIAQHMNIQFDSCYTCTAFREQVYCQRVMLNSLLSVATAEKPEPLQQREKQEFVQLRGFVFALCTICLLCSSYTLSCKPFLVYKALAFSKRPAQMLSLVNLSVT